CGGQGKGDAIRLQIGDLGPGPPHDDLLAQNARPLVRKAEPGGPTCARNGTQPDPTSRLQRGQSGDFGYGWNLDIKVDLQTSPTDDVTFTINGTHRCSLKWSRTARSSFRSASLLSSK